MEILHHRGSGPRRKNRSGIGEHVLSESQTPKRINNSQILESFVAAGSQTAVLALPTKLGPLKASFVVNTGAAVNMLSEISGVCDLTI